MKKKDIKQGSQYVAKLTDGTQTCVRVDRISRTTGAALFTA